MKKTKIFAVIGIILILIQAAASAIALYRVKVFDVLPQKFVALFIAALMLSLIVAIVLQFFRKINIIGYVFSIALTAGLLWGAKAVSRTQETLSNIGTRSTKDVLMQVLIDQNSSINAFRDLSGTTIGICKDDDEYNGDATMKLRDDIGSDYVAAEYEDAFQMAKALHAGDVSAIIINSTKVDLVDDLFLALSSSDAGYLGKTAEGNPISFSDTVKIINTYTITVENGEADSKETGTTEQREIIDTAVTPFIAYISGIDTPGDITAVGRSDVNVIVCVNPVTKMIAMITTPRDSYVPIPGVTDGGPNYDKLTHAGVYGENCKASIAAIEKLYGIDIDYYLKVNFTSVENIVNAIGGVSVYSKYTFDSKNITGFHYEEGYNDVNGKEALVFCRERFSFPDGDYQRGKNHIEMIKAILNKVLSPAILTKYDDLLDEIQSNIETNMSESEITALIKMQLENNASWNIVSCAATDLYGLQQLRYTYSSKTAKSYVTILDPASIDRACLLMEKVLNGEIVTQEQIDAGLVE